jgi:hypothetical protein
VAKLPLKSAPNRDSKGRFGPHNVANPNGRPPAAFSATELLRAGVAARPAVIARLLDLCESEDENVAVKAIGVILKQIDPQFPQSILAASANAQAVVIVRGGPETGV